MRQPVITLALIAVISATLVAATTDRSHDNQKHDRDRNESIQLGPDRSSWSTTCATAA